MTASASHVLIDFGIGVAGLSTVVAQMGGDGYGEGLAANILRFGSAGLMALVTGAVIYMHRKSVSELTVLHNAQVASMSAAHQAAVEAAAASHKAAVEAMVIAHNEVATMFREAVHDIEEAHKDAGDNFKEGARQMSATVNRMVEQCAARSGQIPPPKVGG